MNDENDGIDIRVEAPWYVFVLGVLLLVGFIAAVEQALERRLMTDCEEHGGNVVDVGNGWACTPALERE